MKRPISIVLMLTMCISLFSGCNSGTGNESSDISEQSGPVSSADAGASSASPGAAAPVSGQEQTERIARAQETYADVFGDLEFPLDETNPDFANIMNNFIYGDVYHQSDLLDLKQRELITLVSLTTHQSYDLLKQHAQGALNVGLTPEEITEAVYHCTPYVGYATTYEAVITINAVFQENGISLPLESQRQAADDERFEQGVEAQAALFGEGMRRSSEEVPDGVSRYVSAWCFGDFYTRGALDLKTRELLTMCILANMGVQQFGGHVQGSLNAGYSKDEIIAAVTLCMPYMGTPRTLNAIGTVNQIIPDEGQESGDSPGPGSGQAPGQNPGENAGNTSEDTPSEEE